MATQFRQLGPADADRFAELLVEWHRDDNTPVHPLPTRRAAARILGDSVGSHAWLIQQGTTTAGYLILTFRKASGSEAPRAYVAALYVTPALRHLRLGRSARLLVSDLGRLLGVRVFEFDTEREDKHLHLPQGITSPMSNRQSTPMLQATA